MSLELWLYNVCNSRDEQLLETGFGIYTKSTSYFGYHKEGSLQLGGWKKF